MRKAKLTGKVLGIALAFAMVGSMVAGWVSISIAYAAPSAPTIISPGSSSEPGPVIDTLMPILQWNSVSGADYYALAISKYPYGSGNIIYNPQEVYGTSHQVPNGTLEYGQKYRWNMQAQGSGGWSAISNTLYFQTPSAPPSAPTTISPGSSSEPGPVIDTLMPTLQWNSVSGADYYALAISKYPYGSGNIIYNPQEVYGTSHQVPSATLEYGQKYRWNMQAHGSGGWSAISNTLYFQTPSPSLPGAFTLTGEALCDETSPYNHLSWTPSSGATSYDVYRNSSFYYDLATLGTTFDNTSVTPGATYSYFIRATNANGSTDSNTITLITRNDCGSTGIEGIDVSHWQGNINWSQIYDFGYRFAFVKATGGTGFIDDHFTANMNNGHSAGLLMGAYHFAYPEYNNATGEAQFFLSVAGEYIKAGFLTPALDIEDDPNEDSYPYRMGKAQLSNWINEWMNTVESETGVRPILYVNSNYANNYLDSSPNQYDLWIAHWRCDTGTPPDTGMWGTWDFWQYYSPDYCGENSIPGITGGADLNLFNGDIARLTAEFVIAAGAKTWYVDDDLADYPAADFIKIQEAIDAASSGDTIIVYPGTYTENVDVNKRLILKGTNYPVASGGESASVITIEADDCTIEGFRVMNSGSNWNDGDADSGIKVKSDNNVISNNIISNKYMGIYLWHSSGNILTNNIVDSVVSYVTYGIQLECSCNNMLRDNTILNNYMGICAYYSASNTLTDNHAWNNKLSIHIYGYEKSHYGNSIDTSNIVNGKPVYCYYDIHNQVIEGLDTTHLAIAGSTNITISNNNINGGDGIRLSFTQDSRVTNNTVSNNSHDGIYLDHSSDNIIADNTASSNGRNCLFLWWSSRNTLMNNTASSTDLGIGISHSSNNVICLNGFINNGSSIYSLNSANTWNSPEEITYTYNGKPCAGYLGNYWSDYTGSDADGDGIGDTPYPINSDTDSYPLMDPFEYYTGGPVAELEVYGYEDTFSRSWTRDSVTDLPICNSLIIYEISNVGSGVAANVQVTVKVDGDTFEQYTVPTLDAGESYIAGFASSINHDSSKYVEITASSTGSSRTYGFSVDATLPRAEHDDSQTLFITPNDTIVENTLQTILSSYPSILPDWIAIRDWVGFFVEYAWDSNDYGVDEYFKLPRETIQDLRGDCEDFATLLVSLLRANGWDPNEVYVVVGKNPENEYHAWVILNIDVLGWHTIEPQLDALATFVGDSLALKDFEAVYLFNDAQLIEPCVIKAFSPVDILVTDPDGLVLSKQLSEIPGAWYSEIDLDGDGDLDDQLMLPQRKIGDYTVMIIPEPDSLPTDTYTLQLSFSGVVKTLAENAKISHIPDQGYIIRSTESGISIPSALEIFAFGDANVNGQPDPGEEGLGGWHFEVTGPGGYRWRGSTSQTGSLSFAGPAEGVYTVTETLKQGWYNTTPLVQKVTVAPDTSVRLNFGNREEIKDVPPMVPSVNRWGIITMIALFAGLLVWRMRRSQPTS